MADFFDIQQKGLGSKIRMLTMVLYDSGMTLADRAKAYEELSTIDPTSFPKTSRVALVYSLTRGKLAKSARGIADVKQTKAVEQLQRATKAGYRQSLEDVLYAPDENPIAREQAYGELSNIYPDEFPVKDSVSIKKSIFAGDIAITSKVLHPEYLTPQEQKKLDIQKVKEKKILTKEQEKKLADKLKTVKDQLSTLKNVREKIGAADTSLQSGLLDLAEKRIELETKSEGLDRKSPTYRQENAYLTRHLDILTQREELSTQRRVVAKQRLTEIEAARAYAEARQRYLLGEPEPDINDEYTIYTWNKDGSLAGITTEKRPSVDQNRAREAGEFPYVAPKRFSEQKIFDKETGALTTLPTTGEGFIGIAGHESLFGEGGQI